MCMMMGFGRKMYSILLTTQGSKTDVDVTNFADNFNRFAFSAGVKLSSPLETY